MLFISGSAETSGARECQSFLDNLIARLGLLEPLDSYNQRVQGSNPCAPTNNTNNLAALWPLVGLPIAKVTIGQDFFDLRRDVNNIAITKVTAQTRVLLQPPMMSALPPKADKLTHRNYPQKSKGRPKHINLLSARQAMSEPEKE